MSSLTSALRRVLHHDNPATLSALARAAGVSGMLLSYVRRGEVNPSPETARKIARALATWERLCRRGRERIGRALREAPHA